MKQDLAGKTSDSLQGASITNSNEEYPSAIIAYDLALKAYELAERRLQVVEGRNEKILGYVSSLTLVVVAFLAGSNSPNLKLKSCLFVAALVFGGLSLCAGLSVMLLGRLHVIDMATISKKDWLVLNETEFKKEIILKSTEDYNKNFETIDKKAQVTFLSAALFVIEIILLIIWLLF